MTEQTYTVTAQWDTGTPKGRGDFTRTGQTEAQVWEIRDQLRRNAPTGSTHTVTVEAE